MFGSKKADVDKYAKYERVIVLAGAGMSADLGTPVYWSGDHASYGGGKTEYGYTPLQHAHATLFNSDPVAQFNYHFTQYKKMWTVDAEASHYADLLRFCQQREYLVLTTNIDAAFIHAGFDPLRVWEVHGSYALWQCARHGKQHGLWRAGAYKLCPTCGAVSRPNVLFFDDLHFAPSVEYVAVANSYRPFVQAGTPENTLVLEIGVGATVPRLAIESEEFVRKGFPVVRVNPEHSIDDPAFHEVVHTTAATFCASLV